MVDYEKFAVKTMDVAQERGMDVTDPDAVTPVAKEVAEEYVLDEAALIERVRERATATKHIGNIYDTAETTSDKEVSVLLSKAREWAEQNDLDMPEVDWSEVSPSDDHGNRQSELT